MNRLIATAIVGLLATPVLAEGDAAKGEKVFNKCKACHMIVSDSGETIVKGGKTGPNLFGVIGRTAGTYPDFKYGKDIVAAGEAGLVWDEDTFEEYVQDPRKFLRHHLDDKKAKSMMSFKLKKGGEDVYAYLVSVAPVAAEDTTEDAAEETSTDDAAASE
ncbi:c-type cytochrome [Antarcticimicrobium sediminis]|uniref:Cytochrome C n=1 Tax=Antarcticimicrobium sediminis TaxID=2546227 RepID=A0A4R5ES95_9RHOB|nr:cytochrome C [Antarcticimicrobium sediminis]TDE37520.1 cytochrome C [Antarcticimicrobium sediminis]